jgi:hypothetical protein
VIRSLARLLGRGRSGSDAAPTDRRLMAFARGLALGALVGAAIAGSTLWNRRRRRD